MLKMVSMLEMTEEFRQLYVGITMAAILIMLLVVEIIFAFGVFGLVLVSVIKHFISLVKTKKNAFKSKMQVL